MARRLPIKAKSAAALSVPLAMLLVVAGLEVAQSAADAREVRAQTDLATASIGPSGLISALQNERNFSGLWLLGSEGAVDLPVDSIEEARADTDRAATAFRAEVDRKGGDVARIYAPALASLDQLDDVRERIDAYDGPRAIAYNPTAEETFDGYSDLITALSDQNSQLSLEVRDEVLRQGVRLIDLSSREIDRVARFVRKAVLTAVTGDGRMSDRREIVTMSAMQSEAERAHFAIIDLATGRYADLGEELRVESEATGVRRNAREIVRTGDIDVGAVLSGVSIDDDESYYGFVNDVSGVVLDRADELNAAAQARQRNYLLLAGLVLLVAAVVAPLVSRSITRPLRSLTRQAKEMADRRLPDAVRGVFDA
ncbi:MAG TPA: nitrate- and nitrite sensing domain-containing protein, partial [Acidimicrobiales bacterium]